MRPMRVTRGSFLAAGETRSPSSIVVIHLNLKTPISSLLNPWRVWRKKTDPAESILIAIEIIKNSGESTIKPMVAPAKVEYSFDN